MQRNMPNKSQLFSNRKNECSENEKAGENVWITGPGANNPGRFHAKIKIFKKIIPNHKKRYQNVTDLMYNRSVRMAVDSASPKKF